MSRFSELVAMLDDLSWDEKLYLIEVIARQLRQPATSEDEDDETASRRYLPRVSHMMEWDLLRPQDRLYFSGHRDKPAMLLAGGDVAYRARLMSIMDWAKEVSGRERGINIYREVILESEGKTLDEIRREYMNQHNLTVNDIRPD